MSDLTVPRPASVLLSFHAKNVRSFRDELDLSLLATNLADKAIVRDVEWREGGRPVGVLPVLAIFGANGSGKSNVLKAMDDMRRLVLTSFRFASPTGGVARRPFLLDADSRRAPSRFEVDLVLTNVRHTYGFEVDDDRVLSEWAYRYPRGRAALLFRREGLDVELGPSAGSKGRAVTELLRHNALFLSTAAATSHPELTPLYEWFERNLLLAEADSRPFRQALTTELLADPQWRDQVLGLLRAADLGVVDAVKRELDPVMRERMQRAMRILMGTEGNGETEDGPSFEELGVHLVHAGAGKNVELEPYDESLGTMVWFGVIGPVIYALASGSVFLADEIDASLHPALVAQLIRLFRDEATNPNRAQMIFNTHDATLLPDTKEDRLLGRDQIWFTEKSSDGATRLYPLTDLEPRKQEAVGKRYLAGRYGATPILSEQEFTAAAELITAGSRK
jgi:hypothetical protein